MLSRLVSQSIGTRTNGVLLCAVLSLLLIACSAGAAPAGEAAPAAGPTPTVDINCTTTNPHPIGQEIAATYDRSYKEVMTWFCLGDTFDDILIALETSDLSGVAVEELLDRNREVGWDQVWQDLGMTE